MGKITRCWNALKLMLGRLFLGRKVEKSLSNATLHQKTKNSPHFDILAELKKSLMAKKFILKLKKKFIEAILSKEQCILINDLSYDSVAPHIKKNNKLKKELEKVLDITAKIQMTMNQSKS